MPRITKKGPLLEAEVKQLKALLEEGWSFQLAFKKATGRGPQSKYTFLVKKHPEIKPLIQKRNTEVNMARRFKGATIRKQTRKKKTSKRGLLDLLKGNV